MTAEAETIKCPECGCKRLYKDGLRYPQDGTLQPIQRWLCRKCGLRFSSKATVTANGTSVIRSGRQPESSQICALEAKNLTSATEKKTVVGEKSQPNSNVEGLIAQYMAYLEREGYTNESRYPYLIKRLSRLGANLLDPESVKQIIGRQKIKNGSKIQYVYAYDSFAKMLKIAWQVPHYTQEENLPFVPEEKEADMIIAFCRSKRMAAFLQTLKETYADPGEALRIRWIDITGNIISINFPVKNHNAGQIEVSSKLIAMLNALPRTSELVFPTSYSVMSGNYIRMRRKCAEIQKNPRILSIEFRSFRHLGGSMIAHYTNGNVLTVKKLLRHKRVENTMKYISMIHFGDKDFEVATATTPEEIKQLGMSGWVKYDEMTVNGVTMHFYKKPKRFSNA